MDHKMDHTLFVVQLNGSKIELYSDRNPFHWLTDKKTLFSLFFFSGKKHFEKGKRLGVLSLRAVAVQLSDLKDQIGIVIIKKIWST